MIIHEPEKTFHNGEVFLSTNITFDRKIEDIPDKLWVSFPEKYADSITLRSDAFLAMLISPATFYDDFIKVEGTVSPRLAYNLREYVNINRSLFPDRKATKIHCDQLAPLSIDVPPTGVASAFSGGVDSLHTLWNHLPSKERIVSQQITAALFIQGFDYQLSETQAYQYAFQMYEEFLNNLGVNLISARSNIYLFSKYRIKWKYCHSSALSGIALALSNLIKCFYKPASDGYFYNKANLSYALTDHLFSTESMVSIHSGGHLKRIQKIKLLKNWDVSSKYLRVCTNLQKPTNQLNCGQCEKCLRTMINLETEGVLDKYKSFQSSINILQIFRWWSLSNTTKKRIKPFLYHTWQKKRFGLFFVFALLYFPGVLKDWMIMRLTNLITEDRLYKLRKRFYPH